ncbi:MAG: hypothetical protein MUF00_01500 [Gemmatimonadaceae bacterium]|jgi:hypothetical protein|nr:hypothetical protein [Gemmatimonadaceae bacterium]
MDLRSKVRTTYQAPVPGARIRTRKADAYADWAHALVRDRLVEQCECSAGDGYGSPSEVCGGHAGRRVPEVDFWGEPTGKLVTIYVGIFNEDVRRDMRRRLTKMLRAGWRP